MKPAILLERSPTRKTTALLEPQERGSLRFCNYSLSVNLNGSPSPLCTASSLDPPSDTTGRLADSTRTQSSTHCPRHHLKTTSRAQKQIYGPNCNFFAITDCRRVPKRGFWSENAENQPRKGPFLPCEEQMGVPNRKKVAKALSFLFSQWVDRRNGTNFQKTDRRNGAKSPERRRSLQSQESPVRFDDMHSGGCPRRPIVPHADSHCSHR